MQLLVTILKDYQTVEELMLRMVEFDIKGSTVLEATGMGGVLGNIPLLSSVAGLFPEAQKASHVVLTVTEAEKVNQLMAYAKQKLKIADHNGTGIMFTVELGDVVGLTPSIETSVSNLVNQNEKLLV